MSERAVDQTQLLKGVLDLAVLAVLDHDDSYGYEVVRRLHDAALGEVAEASVYGTLRRLFRERPVDQLRGGLRRRAAPQVLRPHRCRPRAPRAGARGMALVQLGADRAGARSRRHSHGERSAHDTGGRDDGDDRARSDRAELPAARSGRALADLDPTERGELLDEVQEHLLAISSEVELTPELLVARLGPPARYAAELRGAAGLEPRSAGRRVTVMPIWRDVADTRHLGAAAGPTCAGSSRRGGPFAPTCWRGWSSRG